MNILKMRFRSGAAAVLLTLACWTPLAAVEPEDEMKAAAVLGFLRYAEWPKPPAAGEPLRVGVAGRPSFVRALKQVLEKQRIENRPILVVELHADSDPHCCQAIYVAADKTGALRPVLDKTVAAHTLTIGEAGHFLDQGGAVRLSTDDGHLSFEVSLETLSKSGVSISSKLLRLGRVRELAKARPPT
jgi:hypothetical protein